MSSSLAIRDGTSIATSPPGSDDESEAQDDYHLPLTASIILTSLPRSSAAALSSAALLPPSAQKVTIRFLPVGSAPQLRQRVFKITGTQKFSFVVGFLRKKLGLKAEEGVWCYVNNVFAPGGDEVVGNLSRCFARGGELVVGYATMPAFG
jgi:ubiquitin-like protein ATG12